ncbi:asparagine-linked glycosylation protein [Actinomortierella ambigua]|uniref:GDP-Man:Man(3)GlcNAc(2)-PP-Dol alpha-1,2-mannosyltransferase n=1 Tax=Actinomortierella ambigua TaxID=1343610 RepID=A0A9P6Q7D1_9FUNG|nr:asparagine-linked glycosylation protein [Actinomortierella ambigua]
MDLTAIPLNVRLGIAFVIMVIVWAMMLYALILSILNAIILHKYKKNRDRVYAKHTPRQPTPPNEGSSKTKNDDDSKESKYETIRPETIIGFFHPYCNAGGGGERVLWTAIREIQDRYPRVVLVVYTGDTDTSKEDIIAKVKACFNIELDPNMLEFEFLTSRKWVEGSQWPRFTLLGQSLGSIRLAWEALNKVVPDIWFDTMGYAFTYPLARILGGCQVAAYVHYPTISSDMIGRVASRESAHNNDASIASNPLKSLCKLIYYRAFAVAYRFVASFADHVLANSSWTKSHVDSLWGTKATLVFPPCDTQALSGLALKDRERVILSVSQFRPEKGHGLQLEALAALLKKHPEYRAGQPKQVQLVMLGSARNAGDEARIEQLKDQAKKLGVEDNVTFVVNAPFSELQSWLGRAKVGLHTMRDEHFGIGVVEFMSAGLIAVAHNSAGPKEDIVTPYKNQKTGYLATTAEEFAEAIDQVLTMDEDKLHDMQLAARDAVEERFSEKAFVARFFRPLHKAITGERRVIEGEKLLPGMQTH